MLHKEEVRDVKVFHHYEAGNMVTFNCPYCGDEMNIAENGWWSNRCSCGYKWHVELYAYTCDVEIE